MDDHLLVVKHLDTISVRGSKGQETQFFPHPFELTVLDRAGLSSRSRTLIPHCTYNPITIQYLSCRKVL